MAKQQSYDVVSDFIDFLNASPTAFHAVGKTITNSLLSFYSRRVANPHSLFLPSFQMRRRSVCRARGSSNFPRGNCGNCNLATSTSSPETTPPLLLSLSAKSSLQTNTLNNAFLFMSYQVFEQIQNSVV